MDTEFNLRTGPELRLLDPRRIPWPDDTFAIVATEGDRVVGISTIVNMPMIEGTWTVEDRRGSTLAYRLVKHVETLYVSLAKTTAFAMAADDQPEVGGYLERVGYKRFPVTLYVKELTKAEAA